MSSQITCNNEIKRSHNGYPNVMNPNPHVNSNYMKCKEKLKYQVAMSNMNYHMRNACVQSRHRFTEDSLNYGETNLSCESKSNLRTI